MTITVTSAHDLGGGRLVAYLQSGQAAAGNWSYDLGPATAGTHTVHATWPSGYEDVALGVSYLNAGMSHNAGVVEHPRFRTCGAAGGPTATHAPTGTKQPTAPQPTASHPTNEPPTPSPVTTQLGVTG
ncbi:hypothetical protein HJ588_10255 [Flexivirga sp. ID2601S]|uniref:Uncharacterized protein n=1 Tax=Flexivirga aerilata TaxID=1656889 RepID=A0A849ASF0_9MICO|nr:hypothetical protein [Flexivirga aerilata]NNG39652.1 hypothetical protein [Flexivirga aerilata]